MNVFGPTYAELYDALYHDKDYDGEMVTIAEILFKQYYSRQISILDVGCGTGNHLRQLQHCNHTLVGLDRSESMLAHAKEKLTSEWYDPVELIIGDAREFTLRKHGKTTQFDAILCMAAVLGYQLETKHVIQALTTARRHLKEGGIYIFDVWHGPSVLRYGVGIREKVVELNGHIYKRVANGKLKEFFNTCEIEYTITEPNTTNTYTETHEVRYFFPMEIKYLLESCKFQLLQIGQCPKIHERLTINDWHMMVAAIAV